VLRRLLIAVLTLAIALPTLAFGNNMPKPVLTTTHRIEMHVDNPDGSHEGDICSATAIGPHALLTATHCDLGSSLVTIDNGVPTPIVDRIADGNDHTIYIVTATFHKYAELADTFQIGDEVWLRGNPDGLNQLVRRGIVSGLIDYDNETILMIDINGWHGDSGSALFNNKGKIIAVLTYGFSVGGFDMAGCLQMRFSAAQLQAASK
jgi:hypothetical protein